MTTTKITKKYPPVLVVWHDAHADASNWSEKTSLNKKPCPIYTCGLLLEKFKEGHLTIAQSISHDEMFDGVIHIPTLMVISKVYIEYNETH